MLPPPWLLSDVLQVCYLHHKREILVAAIRQRFQLLTGVAFRGHLLEHENLQLVNYGVAGSLRLHNDISPFRFTARLATFMVYLTSPHGGPTVFPVQGVTEEALAGDALLWYGMKADGLKDSRSLHLACPVVAGSKWVANMGVNLDQGWEGGPGAGRGGMWQKLPCGRGSRHYPALHN